MKLPAVVLLASALCVQVPALRAASLPTSSAPGVSAEPLKAAQELVRGEVDAGRYLGAVTLVARGGSIVAWQAFGHRDLARSSVLERNAIFRIYSMTKPVTSLAVLMLMEQGKLGLDDPIGKFLPELANLQVFDGGSVQAPRLRPAARAITIRHLLTHTSGFAVGANDAPVARQLLDGAGLQQAPDLKTYCERLGRVPLALDPGVQFNYDGVQTVVLSRLIEVVAGMPFDQFLHERIFIPLGLEDTGFSVPQQQRARIAELTSTDANGRLVSVSLPHGGRAGDMLNPYPSGAGGLYSTASDYARFSQMLLNGGQLDGVSILTPQTVALMMTNQLTYLEPGAQEFRVGEGFGFGGYVVLDPARRGRPGSPGQFGWFGAASTYFMIDRRQQLIAILMMQHLPQGLPTDPAKITDQFYNRAYQSLVDDRP
jgi:CubicO group peptidase (beta-lactamase class C family)